MTEAAKQESATHRVLLLGNGINRLGRDDGDGLSWKAIVDRLFDAFGQATEKGWQMNKEETPLPFLIGEIRSVRDSLPLEDPARKGVEDAWNSFLQNMACLPPGNIHRLLLQVHTCFDAIITTNYDYSIERALKLFPSGTAAPAKSRDNAHRHHGKVWHIHGEAADKESIVMGYDTYMDEVYRIISLGEENSGTWLESFSRSELHICGLNFRFEEYVLWYALMRRRKECQALPPAYYYNFRASDAPRQPEEQGVRNALAALGVTTVDVPVWNNDYAGAWLQVIGAITANTLRVDLHQSMACDKWPPFKWVMPGYNIITSKQPSPANPHRCWMGVSRKKLDDKAFDRQLWYFDCKIDGVRYAYFCEASALRNIIGQLNESSRDPLWMHLYFDYITGCIYSDEESTQVLLQTKLCPNEPFKLIKRTSTSPSSDS